MSITHPVGRQAEEVEGVGGRFGERDDRG